MKINKILSLLFAVVALTIFSLPADAATCACCAERGFYSIWTGKPDDYLSVLQQIKFARGAELYLDNAGFESVKGLDALIKNGSETDLDLFDITDSFKAKTWKLNFKAKNGKTGTLTLPMPAQMVSFKVDTHNSAQENQPILYKEWRFKGSVQTGNGFFQSGIAKPTTYFLVLQGRGNGCDNPEDFTHWRLEINGKKADYAFIGKLGA